MKALSGVKALNLGLLVLALVAAAGWWQFSQTNVVVTDLAGVLPEQSASSTIVQARLRELAGNRVLLGIFAEPSVNLEDVVGQVTAELNSDYFARQWHSDVAAEDDFVDLATGLASLSVSSLVLAPEDRAALVSGDYELADRRLMNTLFGLPTDVRWQPFASDPYNFLGRAIDAWTPNLADSLTLSGNYLTGEFDGQRVAVLPLAAVQASLDFDEVVEAQKEFDGLIRQLNSLPGIEALASGAVFHIAKSTHDAQREISLFSLVSVLGIVLLFTLAFRTGKALLFTAGSVAFGCFVAVGVGVLWFEQLHVIALVFGCSLIGVGVDYAFHYVCMGDPDNLKRLKSASFLALVSTSVAYFSLLQSDITVVAQVAVLSVFGLVGAWLSVVVVYPQLFTQALPIRSRSLIKSARGLNAWGFSLSHANRFYLVGVVVLSVVGGVLFLGQTLKFNDSVAGLYETDPALVQSDVRMAEVLQGFSPIRYFLVSAKSMDRVLEEMESMKPILEDMVDAGGIQGYQLLADLLPSRQMQQRHRQLLETAYGLEGHVHDKLDLAETARLSLAQKLSTSVDTAATVGFLETHLPHVWVGQVGEHFQATIPLLNPKAELRFPPKSESGSEKEIESVTYVDQPRDWGRGLTQAAQSALWVFVLVAVLVGGVLIAVFRTIRSLSIVLIPACSGLAVLVLLTLFGQAISLFHIFGLYLIIGLGFDYGVFVFRDDEASERCFSAVLLSALTTALAFGMLSQSSTPMIASFGLTVLCGTIFNLFLVPGIRVFQRLSEHQ